MRVFGRPEKIKDFTFKELRTVVPEIPSLEETLRIQHPDQSQFHYMIEVKNDHGLYHPQGIENLKLLLNSFTPQQDFHILSIDLEVYEQLKFLPTSCYLPIARINLLKMSDFAIRNNCAGMTGHFLLSCGHLVNKHLKLNQGFGTGQINSKFWMDHEKNRGITWAFSNNANEISKFLESP
jgi:glycerophosphoryl diester phosphodiesterase